MSNPNLIERLENLIASLEEAQSELNRIIVWKNKFPVINAQTHVENAEGIAGEILTMVDGR